MEDENPTPLSGFEVTFKPLEPKPHVLGSLKTLHPVKEIAYEAPAIAVSLFEAVLLPPTFRSDPSTQDESSNGSNEHTPLSPSG